MPIRRQKIKFLTEELLDSHAVTTAPVPVLSIVGTYGITVQYDNMSGDLSGFLYREKTSAIIGINTIHSVTRQNFTIAHELGHFLLHDQDQLHVDRGFQAPLKEKKSIRLRDAVSSLGYDDAEREANLFAASLLMPHAFIDKDLEASDAIDVFEDAFIRDLAERYRVSPQAFINRMKNLGYIYD